MSRLSNFSTFRDVPAAPSLSMRQSTVGKSANKEGIIGVLYGRGVGVSQKIFLHRYDRYKPYCNFLASLGC